MSEDAEFWGEGGPGRPGRCWLSSGRRMWTDLNVAPDVLRGHLGSRLAAVKDFAHDVSRDVCGMLPQWREAGFFFLFVAAGTAPP